MQLVNESLKSNDIIIRGCAGAGKTTIAKRLAHLLNGRYISILDIRNTHGLEYSEEDKLRAMELAIPIQTDNKTIREVLEEILRILPQNI